MSKNSKYPKSPVINHCADALRDFPLSHINVTTSIQQATGDLFISRIRSQEKTSLLFFQRGKFASTKSMTTKNQWGKVKETWSRDGYDGI